MSGFIIAKPFKVLARVKKLSSEAEYEGDQKKRGMIILNLMIDQDEFREMVRDSIELTEDEREQTVTITIVP